MLKPSVFSSIKPEDPNMILHDNVTTMTALFDFLMKILRLDTINQQTGMFQLNSIFHSSLTFFSSIKYTLYMYASHVAQNWTWI